MKRIGCLVLALGLLLLCACGGKVSGVKLDVGETEMYSEAEIRAAMYVVVDFFEKEMDDCTLNKLSYNEKFSADAALEWAKQYNADQAVVIYSDFDTDPEKFYPALEAGANYSWRWILTRSGNGDWELQTWGYG